jgi:hypothetical protein
VGLVARADVELLEPRFNEAAGLADHVRDLAVVLLEGGQDVVTRLEQQLKPGCFVVYATGDAAYAAA